MAELPMPAASNRWMSFLLVCAAMTGCTYAGHIDEHPVDNQVPALKPGVYDVSAVDVRPSAIREIEPEYPPELGSILTGKAMVVFTVRTDGKVADASVVEADDILFGESAVKAVLKWRFHPARVHGAPVDCRLKLPFVFTSPYGLLPAEGDLPDVPQAPSGDSQGGSVEQK
jgi:TonB family protein